MGLGFFKDVKVNKEPGTAGDRVVLNLNVEEQSTGELSFSAGYSTAEGVIGDISYSERNFMGTGQFVQVKLSGSQVSYGVDTSWTEPRFLDRNLSLGVDAFVRNADYKSNTGYTTAGYEDFKTGGSLRFGFGLLDNVWLNTNYTMMYENIYNLDQGAPLAVYEVEGPSVVSSVGYSLIWDTRNNRKNPTRGFYFSAGQDFAGVGGDVDYVRSVGEVRGYYPLTKDFTLVGRGLAGNIFDWNSGGYVRTTDDFYKGGECVRGFAPAGLGPRDPSTGDSLGGKNFYCATAEIRFPIPFIPEDMGFGGAVFADAGSVWGTDAIALGNQYLASHTCPSGATCPQQAQDSANVRASVGGSLIWNSPIGPLRADFGYALLKEQFDQTQVFRFGAATRF